MGSKKVSCLEAIRIKRLDLEPKSKCPYTIVCCKIFHIFAKLCKTMQLCKNNAYMIRNNAILIINDVPTLYNICLFHFQIVSQFCPICSL